MFFKKNIIITHDGSFHTDDVFACATLVIFLEKENKNYKIIRTRDPEKIKDGNFVVDVGGIYDEDYNFFDHHQFGGAGQRENNIPYASFGLVWKKFGGLVCQSERVANEIDNLLVSSIDAIDNGFDIANQKIKGVMNFSVGDTISFLFNGEKKDENFLKAVDFAKKLLQNIIESIKKSVARREKIEETYKNSSDKRIIVLQDKTTRGDIWLALTKFPEPLFIIYQGLNDDNEWRILANRINMDSFMSRKPFPASWGGIEGQTLVKISGIKDAIFCHKSLFLAGAKSKEGALKMAQKALE